MRTHLFIRLLLIAGFLVLAISYMLYLSISSRADVLAYQEQSPTKKPYDPYSTILGLLQNEVANIKDMQSRDIIEEKLSILQREATLQASGLTNKAARPIISKEVKLTPVIVGTKRTGILDNPSIPFSSMVYIIENGWQEKFGDKYILIFAGSLTEDEMQGVILVDTYSGPSHNWSIFFTPKKDGAVKIVDEKDYRLILEAKNNALIFFDVPSLSFTKSLDEILPTITPKFTQSEIVSTPLPPYP